MCSRGFASYRYRRTLAAAVLLSATVATPVFAQAAIQEPGLFAFYYPNLDVLNGGAPTPAARLSPDWPALKGACASARRRRLLLRRPLRLICFCAGRIPASSCPSPSSVTARPRDKASAAWLCWLDVPIKASQGGINAAARASAHRRGADAVRPHPLPLQALSGFVETAPR
jgi:hypothetical protein